MIQPAEMKLNLKMEVHQAVSTTTKVWQILKASRNGNLDEVKQLVEECPGLIYAQYNYTPPIHFAVREGHLRLVEYLLNHGALDPSYKIYPFSDSLLTIAQDRDYDDIAIILRQYLQDPANSKFKGDNGKIYYNRSEQEQEFENAVDKESIVRTKQILEVHPEWAKVDTFFWGEGILMMPAKANNRKLVELLMSYGAKVPDFSKWCQFYYFEKYEMAAFLLENGMNPNHMSWHHVTLLHDMAQKGEIEKAALLLKHGAFIDPIDEEYQSTPLGMAARWGQQEMVEFLMKQGADINKAGATWATPLEWAKKKGHANIEFILRDASAR